MSDPETGLIRHRMKSNRCKIIGGVVVAAFIIIPIIIIASQSKTEPPAPVPINAVEFGNAVIESFPHIMTTVRTLMGVAIANNGSRAVALGYNSSAAYVISQLEAVGYTVIKQPLVVPVWTELVHPTLEVPERNLSFIWNTDFIGARYGGNCSEGCSVTAPLVDVPEFGCNATDYDASKLADAIAVITTGGGCEFFDKAVFCEQVGCASILFRSTTGTLPNNRVRKTGWVGGNQLISIPCLVVSATTANILLSLNASATVGVRATLLMHNTFNVLTATEGNPERTLISGSHLDSVPEGPGINDNGSGSAMNLQLALSFAALAKAESRPLNRVRFAWWAAEEIGLLGSYHFVNNLINKTFENETIVMALNFDMMASPNGNRQVHNGSQVPVGTSEEVIRKSNSITSLFTNHFESQDKNWTSTDMLGGSDYLPFILAGIPAGGVSTGATNPKTMPQRTAFGGLANAALDPCYHLICDTIENLGIELFMDNSRAAAHVLWTLSHDPHLME